MSFPPEDQVKSEYDPLADATPPQDTPPEVSVPTPASSASTFPETDALKPDPGTDEEARIPTGSTVIDWSGCSYEEGGRLYQGYMPDG
jgi:hypothetical protein